MATRRAPLGNRGFTLVEAIMAITILGILGGMVAVFIRAPIQAYFDTANRTVLTDAADSAIRRISRDVASALPNSLRTTSGAGTACIELLPTVAGGRYRQEVRNDGTGDPLRFDAADATFDVLAQVRLGNLPAGSNLVSIYNLGISGADAYSNDNIATISAATTTNITLLAAKQFPFPSPGRIFHVIPNYALVYSCPGDGNLYRTTRKITSGKLATCPATGNILVSNIAATPGACKLDYVPAVNQRDGILSISLTLTLNNEAVTLYDQVMVNNVP